MDLKPIKLTGKMVVEEIKKGKSASRTKIIVINNGHREMYVENRSIDDILMEYNTKYRIIVHEDDNVIIINAGVNQIIEFLPMYLE